MDTPYHLAQDLLLYLRNEEKNTFCVSDTEEYEFFRAWAIAHPKTSLPTPAPIQESIVLTPIPHSREKKEDRLGKVAANQNALDECVTVPKTAPPLEEFKKLFQKIAPHIPLTETIPSDAKAAHLNRRWQAKQQAAPLSILMYEETAPEILFLTAMQTALSVTWSPTALIPSASLEKDDQWEAFLHAPELKCLLLSESTLWRLPRLLRFFKEYPAQETRFLGKVPLLLLPNLSMYLQTPSLKRSLWTLLCQKIPPILSL